MTEKSVVIIGLPSSGKTTFLAALWHLVTSRDFDLALRFNGLKSGDTSHLNAIAQRWRDAKAQDRTSVSGNKLVSINFLDSNDNAVRVTFPDTPGESYLAMWEERRCDPEVAELLGKGGVLLFVHSDSIQAPQWVVEEAELSRRMGIELVEGQIVGWSPRLAPTQVQLVDILQVMRRAPLDSGPRRLAIMLSAWDKARDEGLNPQAFVQTKLPLLWQYLEQAADDWTYQIYGLSAQGGDYDPSEGEGEAAPEAEEIRSLDCASERIQLVGPLPDTHDLTEPLKWLME